MNVTENNFTRQSCSYGSSGLLKKDIVKWRIRILNIEGRQINYDSNDRRVAGFIVEHDQVSGYVLLAWMFSFQCTAGNFTKFSLRELNILINRGENDIPRNDINKVHCLRKMYTIFAQEALIPRNVIFLAKQAFRKFDSYAVWSICHTVQHWTELYINILCCQMYCWFRDLSRVE